MLLFFFCGDLHLHFGIMALFSDICATKSLHAQKHCETKLL